MTRYDYDLVTIGAGSGGVRASRMAAEFGAKVALAEEHRVGGTCVIRGCVPKKLFVYASHFSSDFRDAAGYGWRVGESSFCWEALRAAKDKEIDRLNGLYISNLRRAGVALIESRAVVRGPHTVFLEQEGREVSARIILVATGSWPAVPGDLEGVEHVVTSNEMFELEVLPRRAVIVGGGYIAVEFAGILNGLGVKTTLLYRGEEILRGFDDEVRGYLHEEMVSQGIDVRVEARVSRVSRVGEAYEVSLEDGERIETDLVMYATGRKPRVSGLGLEACGVAIREDGAVEVDEFSRSSVESLYAIGDATGRVALTPAAIREGEAFARTVFGGVPTEVRHEVIPTAVFSQPALGVVGLTEAQARERHKEVKVYKSAFTPLKHSLTSRKERAFIKLLVADEKVVGVHIMGEEAGELIQAVGIAVTLGATKRQFDETLAVHPTLAEELVTLR